MAQQASKRSVDETDVQIGLKLTALRNLNGMSQNKLGSLLDVTFQQVQKYESGKNRVSASTLMKICKIFKVSPNYFSDEMSEEEEAVLDFLTQKELAALARGCSGLSKNQIHALIQFLKGLKS